MTQRICKECEGCLSRCIYYNRYQAEISPKTTIIKIRACPCTTCLVKVVCNKGCEEYSKFSQRIKLK